MISQKQLTLCLIVKNGENHLPRLLADARNFCDEMVVVDTGSTDETVNIAQQAGARVFSFDWVNDFSKARNFSLEQAQGQWILVLDADERLTLDGWKLLKETIATSHDPFHSLCQVNYTHHLNTAGFQQNRFGFEEFAAYPGYGVSWLTRLFRNHQGYHFQGLVHEHLVSTESQLLIGNQVSIHIHNHGMALPPEQLKAKKQFYYELGKEKARLRPHEFGPNLEVGIAAWELDFLDESLSHLRKAYAIEPQNNRVLTALGSISTIKKDFGAAEKYFKEAITFFPDTADLHGGLGRAYFLQGKIQEALGEYRREIRSRLPSPIIRQWVWEAFQELRKKQPTFPITITVCYLTNRVTPVLFQSLNAMMKSANEILLCLLDGQQKEAITHLKQSGVLIHVAQAQRNIQDTLNELIQRSTCEWILMLSEDEKIDDYDWKEMLSILASTEANIIALPTPRLFRNTPWLSYQGFPETQITDQQRLPIEEVPIPIGKIYLN